MTYFEEIKQFDEEQFIEWFKNQLRKSAEGILDGVQNAIFTFEFPEEQKKAMESVFSLFRLSLTGKFESFQNETEQTSKTKSPSDIIVEAFDNAWEKQNGELPNLTAFQKVLTAISLKDLYFDLISGDINEDIEISYKIIKR